jgi:hypothetical protein
MVYFREVQRLWFWLIFLLPVAIPVVAIASALHRGLGDRLAHKNVLVVAVGSVGLLAIWFLLGSLVTEVRETALSIRFFLLWPEETIPWSDVRQAEAVTYSPMEYHGWGVRWGPEGRVFSVSGNRGVRIQLKGGDSLLVGSQRAYELAQAITERIGAPGDPACYNP